MSAFTILDAECSADTLQTILRDAGLHHYAETVQPGAFASVTIAREDIPKVRALLRARRIKHGV